jgi:hypothetical protein|tara:strand:- start:417 stop:611 length:195 start_codon:yes stop_codon:yes gene_type:complete
LDFAGVAGLYHANTAYGQVLESLKITFSVLLSKICGLVGHFRGGKQAKKAGRSQKATACQMVIV